MLEPEIVSIAPRHEADLLKTEGRVEIRHATGRLSVDVKALHLRPCGGGRYALHVRSRPYLRAIAPEWAAALSLLGVETEQPKAQSRGWKRGIFEVRMTGTITEPPSAVVGVTRGAFGVFRFDDDVRMNESKRWSLTDLASGLACGFFPNSRDARRAADEYEASPETMAKIEKARAVKLQEIEKASTTGKAPAKRAPRRKSPAPAERAAPAAQPCTLSAGRKAAASKGPEGLAAAARKAAATRALRRQEAQRAA